MKIATMNPLFILIPKAVYYLSRLFNLGNGGTWPGEIALKIKPDSLVYFLSNVKKGVILVAGTNGKTTTASLIRRILEQNTPEKNIIIHNESGANLLNGLVSAFIQNSFVTGEINADYAVLEVDENTIPEAVRSCQLSVVRKDKKIIIILLNLFRDQLDRYGEVDAIAAKWQKTINSLAAGAVVLLNADDPQIAFLGKDPQCRVEYFGLNKKDKYLLIPEHATDSIFCPSCGNRLTYGGIYFSHLGIWDCDHCGFKRPNVNYIEIKSPLPGLYNQYNLQAAYLASKALKIQKNLILDVIHRFKPAFGRMEEFDLKGKKIKLWLSKNPAGFNAVLRTISDFRPKSMMIALNDRIPDGRDVSWIWDADFELIPDYSSAIISGDRAYDMALRIKYTGNNRHMTVEPILKRAIDLALNQTETGKTLHILATYSAMLEVRKILTGRKIL